MRYLLAFLLASAAAAQPGEFIVLDESVLEERLRLAHPDNSERYRRLKDLFDRSGCAARLREQAVKGSKEPNIICGVPGTDASPRTIVVGAHFDAAGGDGIIDNWSGAVLLPSLSRFIRGSPRRHTFEFVAFAAEEKGLLGSRAYLKSLSKDERRRIAAVITMDSLGLTTTKFWPNGSDRELAQAAANVAQALQVDFRGVDVDRIGSTDSATFKRAGIPVLSLHSVNQETWRIINSNRDVWPSVAWKDYYDTHRLVSALLVYLDRTLP